MKTFFIKMRDVKMKDILAGFVFLAAIIPSLFYRAYLRIRGEKFWLICEEAMEAQDTGWCFFKYMNEAHKEFRTVYALSRKSPMFEEAQKVGEVIDFATLKHWIYYLSAQVNISSQKGGKPNAAICYVLEVYGILKNRRVFLNHGVNMNDCNFVHYENSKIWLYITSSLIERDYVEKTFNYPPQSVVCTGLSRFDYLEYHGNGKTILLMPSWRNWLKLPSKVDAEVGAEYHDFLNSQYYRTFQSFITNKRLISMLDKYDCKLLFYPHRNIQRHLHHFSTTSERIGLASEKKYKIQELLCDADIMITDYSSVCFDFAYLCKPIIYYQFDEERFRKYQYAEGYFSYRRDGFGPVCTEEDAVLDALEDAIRGRNQEEYKRREEVFFAFHDKKNSERIYQEIMNKLSMEL